jgi:hypothetical protein
MSQELSGILIGICSMAGATILAWIAAALVRLWRTPKRIDRLEKVVPIIGRGVWALLAIHVREHNGDTDPMVINAYDECTRAFTDGVVSQKAKP